MIEIETGKEEYHGGYGHNHLQFYIPFYEIYLPDSEQDQEAKYEKAKTDDDGLQGLKIKKLYRRVCCLLC